jgi:hypothetical protein
VDVGKGLACKNSCEKDVLVLKQSEAQAHGSGMFVRPIVASIGSLMMFSMGVSSHHFFLPAVTASALFAALAFWETNRVLKTRRSKLPGAEPPVHEIDFLDHEFKKLERDTKQNQS